MGPSDSPFGGPRRATIAAASGAPFGGSSAPIGGSGAPMFTAPFGLAPTVQDSSPFANQPMFNSPFGATDPQSDEPVIPSYALGRRTSVSAESLVPANHRPFDVKSTNLYSTAEEDENESTPNPNSGATPVFPKSDDQLERIRAAIKPNFLFRNLDEEQETDVLAAMKEVSVEAGEKVIEQGAAGDFFYVVESGRLDVFVKKEGQVLEAAKGDSQELGKKVHTCVGGNSFGELALMHK
jgi:cAMP-dependent protein kinase regulator